MELKNEISAFLTRYDNARYSFFRWRYESTYIYKLSLALGFALITGILAQIRIPLPFTPVPITGQVFAVLLGGVVLGKNYGALSQGFYAALGGAGVPWFSGMKGGIPVLTGVTGGYILGFIVAAGVIGWFTDRYLRYRDFKGMLLLMLLGIGIIHALGALQLSLILHIGLIRTLELGVLPFIPGDLFKAFIAASIAGALTPKTAYNGEVDA